MGAEQGLRAPPHLQRIGRDHLNAYAELGQVLFVHLAHRFGGMPVMAAPVCVERSEQAASLDHVPYPEHAGGLAFFFYEAHGLVFVGGVIHRDHQVPLDPRYPLMKARTLVQHHARPNGPLPTLAVQSRSSGVGTKSPPV